MINTHASEGVTTCSLDEPVKEENLDSDDSSSSSQTDPEADDLTWEDIVDIWFSIMPEHEEFRGGRL
ncbi:hypothetical protein V18_00153 [Escherichia phage V18]|uniref:Uncharacterized protein n=1 Tax=Escherichia phage V18 TaxID=1981500 RepID=A0A220NU99_9CAUD|nr:hypothetical protein FDH54_gp130 [Escherichia phage V18]ASJ80503.1 hypothetical protein V18_00153 [Escherichia phage V18]